MYEKVRPERCCEVNLVDEGSHNGERRRLAFSLIRTKLYKKDMMKIWYLSGIQDMFENKMDRSHYVYTYNAYAYGEHGIIVVTVTPSLHFC